MPKYIYKCKICDSLLTFYHSISENRSDCTECGTKDILVKTPPNFMLYKDVDQNKKVGDEVKKSIEDFRSDLEDEKQRLRESVWQPDD